MRFTRNSREGFALALALFAMVVIGGIIAGAFFASNQNYRTSRNTLLQERALAAAEYGMNQVINAWDANWNTQFAVGSTRPPSTYLLAQSAGPADRATVRVTRLNDLTFWIVSEGMAGSGISNSGRRRVGQILRLYIPTMNFLAALTVKGATKVGGSSYINGVDANPNGWSCPSTEPALPGLATDNLANITYSGCSDGSCLNGDPKVEENPLAGHDSTYFDYGGITWDELVAMATKVMPHGGTWNSLGPKYNADLSCNRNPVDNWGDPNRNPVLAGTCEGYFPVIYYPGTLKITGGVGQGILLVGGDLEVQGGFQFFGPVIVRGNLVTAGTGGHFNGGVMAANVSLEQNSVLGNAVIQYSSCAILSAQMGSTLPTRARDRAWADMF